MFMLLAHISQFQADVFLLMIQYQLHVASLAFLSNAYCFLVMLQFLL